MDRRLRDDGSEQGSANIWLCGIPPTDAIPNFNFTGLNTTLLYVAPPEKIDEVRIVKKKSRPHDLILRVLLQSKLDNFVYLFRWRA